ncbi:MAG: sugar ABC transporter substrate-binding protein [Spirochaetes bacterium]|nr:MAG: sugar ABC transporter substrate-binding protein [Spirochaetota bacterium]RKX80820.1 MAG: sugar ABC transporter substrate-binding protein [Spirochaetota bacterium]RKX87118.1 MAG: sugar ABC transporter substrate-binding protein [Spirochaetota bacterium]RKX98783.1 MAG: sugar ABC transporter substrate-binding protein [Spirochaetota bacterium]
MKRILLSSLILILSVSSIFAGGAQDEAPMQSDDVTTIRIVGKDFSPSDEVNLQHLRNIEAGFEKATGEKIKLELVSVPEGAYGEKLNLMIMAGDIPDLIYFQGGDEVIANQGLLVDLTDYVKNSAVMQDVLMDFNKERLANYPYLLWIAPPRARTAVIREDWFNEAGGKMPVTVDDYYALFSTIKKNHPEAAVVTDTGNTGRMDFTFNQAFGITATWVKENGKYVYSKVSQAEKDKLAFYQKLYAEGILDNEYITTKWDTMEDKLYTGKVAGAFGTAGIVLDIYSDKMNENQGVGLVVLPPADGVGRGYSVSSAKETRGWAISTTSEHSDLVFELLEFLATDEGQFMERYGIEGIHYNMEGDKVVLTDKKGDWWPRFHEVMSWDAPTPLLGPAGMKGWEYILDYAVSDPDFPIPEELSPTWDALGNLYKEYSFKIISGEYSIDKFDDFVAEWYKLGGDKVTEYANSVLN